MENIEIMAKRQWADKFEASPDDPKTANCIDCGIEIEFQSLMKAFSGAQTCPPCKEKRQKQQEERAEKERIEKERHKKHQSFLRMKMVCPAEYIETKVESLPNPAAAKKAMAWQYGKKGMIFHGATRRGKTRCAWLVAKTVIESEKTVEVLDSMSAFRYMAAFSSGGDESFTWIMDKSKCGLLIMDDVFKAKLTESYESAIFAIIDYRCANGLPIIATLNDTGDTLMSRMTQDRGGALVARLREMCEVVKF